MELRDLKIGFKGFKDWFTKHFPDSKAWVRELDGSYGIVSLVMITSVQHTLQLRIYLWASGRASTDSRILVHTFSQKKKSITNLYTDSRINEADFRINET